ncbi:MAG: hypothetical protein ACFB10_14755 [Salibacteraceae bacterium]
MKYLLLLIACCSFSLVSHGEKSVSHNIAFLVDFIDVPPNVSQKEQIARSLNSDDELERTLAISILFKFFPKEYEVPMMDAFEIPYEDQRRVTVEKFYRKEEVNEIDREIAKDFRSRYKLTDDVIRSVYTLYTFLEYRKRNVWTYVNDRIAIPTTVATRGGFLRSLLLTQMDYKEFITDMDNRTTRRYAERTGEQVEFKPKVIYKDSIPGDEQQAYQRRFTEKYEGQADSLLNDFTAALRSKRFSDYQKCLVGEEEAKVLMDFERKHSNRDNLPNPIELSKMIKQGGARNFNEILKILEQEGIVTGEIKLMYVNIEDRNLSIKSYRNINFYLTYTDGKTSFRLKLGLCVGTSDFWKLGTVEWLGRPMEVSGEKG